MLKTSANDKKIYGPVQRVNFGDTVYLRTLRAIYDVATIVGTTESVIFVRFVGKKFNRKKRRWFSAVIEEPVERSKIVQMVRYTDGKFIQLV